MKQFEIGQRIVVDNVPGCVLLHGKTGQVDRLGMCDNGAWINMDEPLPEGMASFPVGDARVKTILLYPEDCSPI